MSIHPAAERVARILVIDAPDINVVDLTIRLSQLAHLFDDITVEFHREAFNGYTRAFEYPYVASASKTWLRRLAYFPGHGYKYVDADRPPAKAPREKRELQRLAAWIAAPLRLLRGPSRTERARRKRRASLHRLRLAC